MILFYWKLSWINDINEYQIQNSAGGDAADSATSAQKHVNASVVSH